MADAEALEKALAEERRQAQDFANIYWWGLPLGLLVNHLERRKDAKRQADLTKQKEAVEHWFAQLGPKQSAILEEVRRKPKRVDSVDETLGRHAHHELMRSLTDAEAAHHGARSDDVGQLFAQLGVTTHEVTLDFIRGFRTADEELARRVQALL